MTRDELIKLLARGIQDGWLTEEKAIDLLKRFDRGETVDVKPPLTLGQMLRNVAALDVRRRAVESLMRIVPLPPDAHLADLRQLTAAERIDTVDLLQSDFEARARALAEKLASGELTPAQWQTQLGTEVRLHLFKQNYLATGSDMLTPEQLRQIEATYQREMAYLSRFADQVAVQVADGKPLSSGQIGARSELYAGSGRGEHFRLVEEQELREGRLGVGWVVKYQAKGDASTCDPCFSAEGYYHVGQGPFPGTVCRGRSRCRCRRLATYAPEIYASLAGGA